MSLPSILGPDGAIARRLSNYEARPQQLAMAEAVAQAIAAPRHLMVEAPTGVGKSFAYLVPAVQAAAANKECRVVISTHTISLQEQLVGKDIPFLQAVMPERFHAVLVKGRAACAWPSSAWGACWPRIGPRRSSCRSAGGPGRRATAAKAT